MLFAKIIKVQICEINQIAGVSRWITQHRIVKCPVLFFYIFNAMLLLAKNEKILKMANRYKVPNLNVKKHVHGPSYPFSFRNSVGVIW